MGSVISDCLFRHHNTAMEDMEIRIQKAEELVEQWLVGQACCSIPKTIKRKIKTIIYNDS